jgi:glycosyltransferase involved in cell wall biosynthesis
MPPKISVIMPVYNGEKYVREAIQSVLDQTFSDFEFIIVDDGSTDNSGEAINSFKDERIRYEQLPHRGLIHTLNHAIQIARGTYIARMDADDIALPERLARQVEYMDTHPDIAVCGSWATCIDKNGDNIGSYNYPPVENKKIKKYALIHNPFIHPSVVIRKEMIEKVGGYRAFWKHTEDYELWTRVLSLYKGTNIPEYLLKYRVHDNQVTASKSLMMRVYGVLLRALACKRLFIF